MVLSHSNTFNTFSTQVDSVRSPDFRDITSLIVST